jgi:hypothetical protein
MPSFVALRPSEQEFQRKARFILAPAFNIAKFVPKIEARSLCLTLVLPIIPAGRMASAAVGPPVPSTALGKELRQSLPPTLWTGSASRLRWRFSIRSFAPLLWNGWRGPMSRSSPSSEITMPPLFLSCGASFRKTRSGFLR